MAPRPRRTGPTATRESPVKTCLPAYVANPRRHPVTLPRRLLRPPERRVKRGPAGRAIRDSALRPNEKLVMLALLDRADNEDSTIPAWRSPSLRAVESDTSLAHSTVVTVLAHLEMHGWLERSGQKRGQMPKTKESGRGRSSTRWALLPHDFAPVGCTCPKPDRPSRDQSKNQIGREATNPDRSRGEAVSAGQGTDGTKGGRDEGDRGKGMPEPAYLGGPKVWDWPEDSAGAWANPKS